MKVNITGLLRQAAAAIDPRKDQHAYAYMLEEIASHVEDVRSGKHTIQEFADAYMIVPMAPSQGVLR